MKYLHLMHPRLRGPTSEPLTIEVEWDGTETPERCQTHVDHDWLDEATFHDPRGDELAKAVSPDILVDGD